MNLTIVENNAIASLPVSVQMWVTARFKKPIREYDGYELEQSIKNLIMVAYAEMGHTTAATDDKVITFLRETLTKDFKRPKYSWLTLEAIHLFISNGIRGDYGTFNGQLNTINVQNIHHWIRMGLESREWKESIQQFNALCMPASAPEISEEEKLKRSKQALLNLFDEYKETSSLGVCPWAYCGVLAELIGTEVEYAPNKTYKTFVTDPMVRLHLNTQAEEEYLKECQVAPLKSDFYKLEDKRGGSVEKADKLMRAIVQQGQKKEDALANKKKEVALRWYFDQLILQNKDLQL